MKSICTVTVCALAASVPSHTLCAQGFDPFPSNSASAYHFDLAKNFYASPEAELRSRDTTASVAERAASLAQGATTARGLLAMLVTADSAQRRLGKHLAYLTLRFNLDSRDSASTRGFSDVARTVQTPLARVQAVLAAMPPATFAEYLRQLPALRPYQFAATRAYERNQARPNPGPPAPPDAARIAGAGPGRFNAAFATIQFGRVSTPSGDLDLRTQLTQIFTHTDRSVREAGYKQSNAALAPVRDTMVAIMTEVAFARNAMAKAAGFADFREQDYGARDLTVAQVERLLSALRGAADVNRRYEQMRVKRIRKQFGYADVHVWDLTAPPPGRTAPRFTFPEARDAALTAAKPLGDGYVSELRKLLDPANGRLDLIPRPFRAERPGFSTGSVGYPSVFFQGRYSGFLDDIMILVHEAGHAAQNMLMDAHGVLPRNAAGPGYFTESYAGLSELMAFESLARTTTDRDLRIQYTERLLDQATEMFRSAFETAFEDRIYADAARGVRHTAPEFEQLFREAAAPYSMWFGPGGERAQAWMQPLQFYTLPLYRLNYVLAKLLALNYAGQLHDDPARFQPRFVSLLSRGYDATPAQLLREEMGIDFNDVDGLVKRASSVIREWMLELEKLYEVP
ncbi:MAG TPA: M3 family metallopeptidase [Gemmatimonadaceae bacterium]|nr:M3 family metallopeptidase [Gemmatimonadaceae bacterium]